ncbi:MAG: peptidase M64 [Planctomycetes bacterium]|nr:peptidase M64 [Planctomycetota bacterium]
MRTALALSLVLAACQAPRAATHAAAPSNAADAAFGARFTGATLRFDYVHCGTAKEEHVAPAGYRLEGEWPGSRVHLVDDTDLGLYRFRLFDAATKTELFSRGFASIYGEWETTGPAKAGWGSFEESQRFPEPKVPATLVLEKRGDDGAFHELWRGDVDPASRFVDRSALPRVGEVISMRENGPSANHVDLLVVADGYTAEKRGEFVADVKRLTDVLLATEPYKRNANAFNVRALFVATPEEGISNPRKGVWRDGAFGLSFNAFDSDRYVLTYEDRTLRDAAAQAPYDALILLFDERKYGGGGIYNLWATCASDTEPAPYVFVHEFGHSFAGLADEYYSSQVAYESTGKHAVEPWEPNVTALLDPSKLKWKDLVDAATPLPTPWDQKRYDAIDLAYQKERKALIDAKSSEEASEALMRSIQTKTEPLLHSERFFGKVGAFEGCMYEAKGLYRPEADCIMFTRNPKSFCKVCERAIERVLRRFTE